MGLIASIFNPIIKVIASILKSFTADKEGASGRKLSAFQSIVMASILSLILAHICNRKNLTEPLLWLVGLWLLGAAVFLGMVTFPQLLMALKTVKGDNTTDTTTEIKSTTETHETN